MNAFDIVGPVMIGPSSSHTAGALRLGRVAHRLLGEVPVQADITLHDSFAATGRGHGTDRAILAGLMGLEPDDERIRTAFQLAAETGLSYSFHFRTGVADHPNTVDITAQGAGGRTVRLSGASVGGGSMLVKQINGISVEFTGELHTLIVVHRDKPGVVAGVSQALAAHAINIASMRLYRKGKGGQAIMLIETDQPVA
jgi:L-serine dehydratase